MRQNSAALSVLALWFVGNLVIFGALRGLTDGLATTFFFRVDPGRWGTFYHSLSGFVVFGVTVNVVVTDLYRRYRPEDTCRLLAGGASDHVVVVGYTNFGRRVCELLWREGRSVVVIDDRRAEVAGLIEQEHPLVLGGGRDTADFAAANVARASLVVVASDDMETVAIAARLTRQQSQRCALLLRCADDDVGDVLAKTYLARAISTSRMAASFVAAYADKHAIRSCVIIGDGNIARRLVQVMKQRRTEHTVVEADPTDVDVLAAAGVRTAELVVLTDNDLGHNLVVVDRVRDLNPWCRIVCRVFEEDAAEVLKQKPFGCEVISTSKHAVDTLVREGAFRAVRIERLAPGKPRVAMA